MSLKTVAVSSPDLDYVSLWPRSAWNTPVALLVAAYGGGNVRVSHDRGEIMVSFEWGDGMELPQAEFKALALERLKEAVLGTGDRRAGVTMGTSNTTNISHSTVHGSVATGNVVNQQVTTEASRAYDEAGQAAVLVELDALRKAMQERAGTASELEAMVAVAKAAESARAGDKPTALQHLRAGGTAALKVAQDIGTRVIAQILATMLMPGG